MKADKAIAIYRRLRTQPLWRLLAANTGPTVIGLLQAHLYENERSLPASIFYERISRDLETLRARGEDFPQTAQAYVASWLADGYLERRFPTGASEEEYELSTAAVEAIRFISGLAQPHSAATESRLTLVIEALARLAEDTDTDKSRRINRLMAERARIDKEIDAIHKGQMRVLPDADEGRCWRHRSPAIHAGSHEQPVALIRQRLSQADSQGDRAVIAADEIVEFLTLYERAANTDRAGFVKKIHASIEKIKKHNILQKIRASEDRFEISPTLKLLFSAEEIQALTRLYQQMAAGTPLDNLDMLIAAHAMTVDAVLVTNDQAFMRVPTLKVENRTVPG